MSQRRFADSDSDDGGASSDDASQPPRSESHSATAAVARRLRGALRQPARDEAMSQRRFADSDSDDGGASSDDASQPPRRLSRTAARSERQCECFCGELLELFWDSCGMCCVPVTVMLGVLVYVLTMPQGEQAATRESDAVARIRASAAPVRRFGSSPWDGPVDLVFLWVNGSDPHHRQALRHARETKLLPYTPHASRFRDEGIFEYVLRSALGAAAMAETLTPNPKPNP